MITLKRTPDATPLMKPWKRCIGMGRAYELLRADVLDHLEWLQEHIGFEACRFHALFHDDMDVMRLDADGRPYYQWHHIDKVYDNLLALGLKPFVELNPMPQCIASGGETMFFYKMNITPPSDWDLWEDLIYQFTRHVTDRYGEDEVSEWYFEVWNEPNLSGFWSGTKEQYFELYRRATIAVKRVNESYRVGGPASSKGCWIGDLIAYCDENDVPIDFISTHLYGQDEYVEYPGREGSPFEIGTFFTKTVEAARQEIDESTMPDLELHWTEWNTQMATPERGVSWGENPDVDTAYGAAHVVKHCLELDEVLDSFSYWVATDIFEEGGIPDAAFSCTYGLLTVHGIPKANANAFRFLEKLNGPRLDIDGMEVAPDYAGMAATREGDRAHLLLYYFNPHEIDTNDLPVWDCQIDLSAILPDGKSKAIEARILPGQGSCWEAWQAMGAPLNLTLQEEEYLRAASEPVYTLHPALGKTLTITVNPGQVVYIETSPVTQSISASAQLDGDFAAWDEAMGEKSR